MQANSVVNPIINHSSIDYTREELKEAWKLNRLFKLNINASIKKAKDKKNIFCLDKYGVMRII